MDSLKNGLLYLRLIKTLLQGGENGFQIFKMLNHGLLNLREQQHVLEVEVDLPVPLHGLEPQTVPVHVLNAQRKRKGKPNRKENLKPSKNQ
ncbi:MAG: hypothetical protein ACOC44_13810 [Promethearchaeia archaeon]